MNRAFTRVASAFFASSFALLMVACGSCPPAVTTTQVAIIPQPTSITLREGDNFTLTPRTSICVVGEDSMLLNTAVALNEWLAPSFERELKVKSASEPQSKAIVLMIDTTLLSEAYRMDIAPTAITLTGGDAAGVFYAAQSLRQLLPAEVLMGERVRRITLPGVAVEDAPAFGYRGTMLDVGRHFYGVEDMKRFIDMIAMHKINRLHWHLTEDQGWRIEIKRYPELTRIGSVREKDLTSHASIPPYFFAEAPYGGYYTQDQVREIVAYAADRFITVIPEIELPGHAEAALASYPYLGCRGKDYEVSWMYGVHDEVFCAGRESTFAFLEGVLEEVIELFPSKYIHIGGDECRKGRWEECAQCQQRIRAEGLKDEYELQSYFVQRIERFVRSKGREIIGWDEILEGGLSPTATVMSWRGTEGGIEAAKMGNHVIMSPYQYCYFDYYQSKDHTTEPLAIRDYLPVEKVYSFDPYAGLNEQEQQYIDGVQGNIWTEYIRTLPHVEYMTLPRLAALSEVAWSTQPKDFEGFKERMNSFVRLYDGEGYNYATHLFRGVE